MKGLTFHGIGGEDYKKNIMLLILGNILYRTSNAVVYNGNQIEKMIQEKTANMNILPTDPAPKDDNLFLTTSLFNSNFSVTGRTIMNIIFTLKIS